MLTGWLLGLGIAATLAANLARGLGHSTISATVPTWPAGWHWSAWHQRARPNRWPWPASVRSPRAGCRGTRDGCVVQLLIDIDEFRDRARPGWRFLRAVHAVAAGPAMAMPTWQSSESKRREGASCRISGIASDLLVVAWPRPASHYISHQ